jgi:dihydrofolate synthase/folylpolyglutamate synthase
MTYQQTLDYLFEQLPMFHRIGAAAYKADLNNTLAICKMLNHPETVLSGKSIHIAGTNGKGSSSHMLAAILQTAGYKTGLYTSPHLKDFRERIRINGNMIEENVVTEFVEQYRDEFENIKPSFFEWTVGLAFNYFTENKIDIAVIETGLGGRLDSTNVITPLLSVITNIGWDHTQLLGNTLEKIAAEKAGIIKQGIPVVIGEKQDGVEKVFRDKATEVQSKLFFADEELRAEMINRDNNFLSLNIFQNNEIIFKNLQLDLHGNYQLKNILSVIKSVLQLQTVGFTISDEHIYHALKNVKDLTGLMGRWQTLSHKPLTICDVAHNKNGIEYVVEQIRETLYDRLHVVLGVVSDKDVSGILELLPEDADYYFCKANIPRAMDANELKIKAKMFSLNGNCFSSVREALHAAQLHAKENDLVFIGGSTFVVAEVL